ncbi:Hpt domain-containing protein [Marinospirillum sp. MEB164]|uniref:Hpt domain-containing protein n=1 Tax=Marinospirillum alkalitolerans TaxID=3123374 RepID=A0ABW8PXS4_9GAMM
MLQKMMVDRLPERQQQIEQAWQNWQEQPHQVTTQDQLVSYIHQLAGAAGSYQLSHLYQAAKACEDALKNHTDKEKVHLAYTRLIAELKALSSTP